MPASSPWEGEAPAEPKSVVSVHLSLFALNRSPGIPDARDKTRSLGFSPGTNFWSSLKSPVFFMDGAEQECSGYILSSASFLPGRLLPTQSPNTAHVCPSLCHSVG